ncbi:HNH endonuclease [Amycolatopsis xylanica]|uniref:HNH endonuclease n=2 Tax=Amycolatopsis xylanica TaxID=589385 RepID=A0A1H3NPA3_9PSEU|nr:HNH endonuclease [Amycolatopsis xylanica]
MDLLLLNKMTRAELLSKVVSAEAERSRLDALKLRGVALLADSSAGSIRSVIGELAFALSMTKSSAGKLITVARDVTRRLPGVLGLMEAGKLDYGKAAQVSSALSWLSDDMVGAVDAILVERLVGKDPRGVRRCANKLAAQVDPEGLERRAAQKRAARRVTLTHQDAGSARLSVEGPAEKCAAAYTRIDRLARKLSVSDRSRTLEQLRADVMMDLCLSGTDGIQERAEIFVYIDYLTLAGVREDPGFLAGHGPIPAATARDIAAGSHSVLRRLITDPATGQPTDLGRSRYRPNKALDEFVRVRDQECRAPGCTRPAQVCQLDHTEDWAAKEGETNENNLASLCQDDHKLKDEPGWRYALGGDATLTVTTPTGDRYSTKLEPLHEPRYTDEQPPPGSVGKHAA